ncbi:hypothetical protein RUM43_012552 [Polyplax serrata]|uniref:Uncharacterized protein n=1 Tax=Polyplax serrata TaxID=468196 RepID=A0AAN8PDS8_POLSC
MLVYGKYQWLEGQGDGGAMDFWRGLWFERNGYHGYEIGQVQQGPIFRIVGGAGSLITGDAVPGKRTNRDVIISYTSESELELNDIDDDSLRFISRAARESEGPARPQGRPRKGDSRLSPEELPTRAKRNSS